MNAQMVIQTGDVEFIEEHIAHFGAVMLVGAHDAFAHVEAVLTEGAGNDRRFDELRAGDDDSGNSHIQSSNLNFSQQID